MADFRNLHLRLCPILWLCARPAMPIYSLDCETGKRESPLWQGFKPKVVFDLWLFQVVSLWSFRFPYIVYIYYIASFLEISLCSAQKSPNESPAVTKYADARESEADVSQRPPPFSIQLTAFFSSPIVAAFFSPQPAQKRTSQEVTSCWRVESIQRNVF